MDPALWELLEEGPSDDEIAAIIRLRQSSNLPPGVRVITQYGEIVSVRMKRGAILEIHEEDEVASLKAPGPPMGPDVELSDAEIPGDLDLNARPTDERRPLSLEAAGKSVVIGIIDWGLDINSPAFRNPDGSTRILALWDQRGHHRPESPQPYGYGIVHNKEDINQALASGDPYTALNYHPADSDSGAGAHGTLVTSIAASNGRDGGPVGVAPEASIVFVHLTTWERDRSTRLGDSVTLLEAADFILKMAGERPCAINISLGRTGDRHDGTTLVEQGFDAMLRAAPGRAICQSTGNYYNQRLHASGQLRPAEKRDLVWEISNTDVTPNQLEIWYAGRDRLEVEIRSPDEEVKERLKLGERVPLVLNGKTIGRAYHRAAEPNNLDNHIVIVVYPEATVGAWIVTLIASDVVDGRFHAWIERDSACSGCQSHFHIENADPTSTTGTICNGLRTIAVGAYNPHEPDQPMGTFSSMGPTRDGRLKPDLCAPGVEILGTRSAPRDVNSELPLLTRMSGTSFAAPHVTGTIALMFEVAPRPLRIEEVHNLLLASTRKVRFPEERPGRVGSGYLDIERAVEAVQQIDSVGLEAKATNVISEAEMRQEEQAMKSSDTAECGCNDKATPETIDTQKLFPNIASDSRNEFNTDKFGIAFDGLGNTKSDLLQIQAGQPEQKNLREFSVPETIEGPCPDVETPHRLVSRGSVHPAVREAQRKLNHFHQLEVTSGRPGLPNAPLKEDCRFGKKTTEAVLEFQRRVFPEQPREHDGKIGDHTWAQLDHFATISAKPQSIPVVHSEINLCSNLMIWINAFIPENVPGYTFTVPAGPHKGKTAIPCPDIALPVNPRCRSRGYLTDQRSFDASPTESVRMRSMAVIQLIPPSAISLTHVTSGTTEIDKTTGAVTCSVHTDMSRCKFENFRVEPDPSAPFSGNFFIKLSLTAAASDPCVNLAADIDYKGEIIIFCSPKGNFVEVSFSGKVDEFPAFEMYASLNGVTNTLFRIPPPPGNTVVDLLGFANNMVTGRATFTHCQLIPLSEQTELALEELSDTLTPSKIARYMEFADQALAQPTISGSPTAVLKQAFDHAGLPAPRNGILPSAAEIFDSFAYPKQGALLQELEENFEMVGSPRSFLDSLQAGDLIVRRAEGGLGHVSIVVSPELWDYEELISSGLTPEVYRRGQYVQVIEGGIHPHTRADFFARQITDDMGRLPHDQLVLRIRDAGRPSMEWGENEDVVSRVERQRQLFEEQVGETIIGDDTTTPLDPFATHPISASPPVPSVAPRELTYTAKDVIDNRISIPAQHSLVRLSKNPATSVDAVGMLEEIKAGRLAGIYCVNWEKSALRTRKLGKSWWTVIPQGEDAILILDPDNPLGGQPLIAFRRELSPDCGLLKDEKRFPGSPARLDAALLKVWASYRLWQFGQLAPCGSQPSLSIPVTNIVPSGYCQTSPKSPPMTIPPDIMPPGGDIPAPPPMLPPDVIPTVFSSKQTIIPIIIVPGIMGTRLVDPDKNGVMVWNPLTPLALTSCTEGFGTFAANRNRLMDPRPLAPAEQHDIKREGSCVNTFFKAQVIPHFGNLFFKYYFQLAFSLNDPGFSQQVQNKTGKTLQVYGCGYDWRQDNAESARRLDAVVKEALRDTGAGESGKVIVVAHSMGGLVSRYYCKKLGGESRVAALILLGTPNHGAPRAYALLKEGIKLFSDAWRLSALFPATTQVTLMRMLRGFPSVYQLLPTEHYCQNHPDWLFFNKLKTILTVPPVKDASNAQDLYSNGHTGFLDGINGDPMLGLEARVSRALLLRAAFDATLFDPVQGCYMPSPTYIIDSSRQLTDMNYRLDDTGSITNPFRVSILKKGKGDKTVPFFSAEAVNCPNIVQRRDVGNVEHDALPNDPGVIKLIKSIVMKTASQVAASRPPAAHRIPTIFT